MIRQPQPIRTQDFSSAIVISSDQKKIFSINSAEVSPNSKYSESPGTRSENTGLVEDENYSMDSILSPIEALENSTTKGDFEISDLESTAVSTSNNKQTVDPLRSKNSRSPEKKLIINLYNASISTQFPILECLKSNADVANTNNSKPYNNHLIDIMR